LCFILKIDRMLYGFFFSQSALLKLKQFSNGSRQKQKCYGMIALRAASRSWAAVETFRSMPG
jgi:DNA phosphorothioation-dependent restriction protein DptG